MAEKAQNPAVAVAKRDQADGVREVVLSTGHRARLTPVATSLLETVRSQVKDPDVPMWLNESKEREEPNPVDPTYLQQRAEAGSRRSAAIMDALMLFGVELLDGLPEDDDWLDKLRLMQRLGTLDLSDLDLDDQLDRRFAYLKFVAIAAADYWLLSELSGVTPQGVAEQAAMFPGDEEGTTD